METAPAQKDRLKKASESVMIMGGLILLLGILALIYPTGFGKFTTIIIGLLIITGGFLRLIFAVTAASVGSMILRYLFAILMIIAGVAMISNSDMGLEALTLLMAVYFIVDGIAELFYAYSLRKLGRGKFLFIGGIASLILGIIVYSKWPESSRYAIGLLLGIKFLLDGFSLTTMGYSLKKSLEIMRGQNPQ
jgi:uncharacterized membrane protein HdeD (DUF308 family)